jgi:hypothetical protein
MYAALMLTTDVPEQCEHCDLADCMLVTDCRSMLSTCSSCETSGSVNVDASALFIVVKCSKIFANYVKVGLYSVVTRTFIGDAVSN